MTTPLTAETLGSGVIQPHDWINYSSEKAMVVPVYSNDDMGIVVWCLEPGQEHSCHLHPACCHAFVILEGEGSYLQGDPDAADYAVNPVKAGEMVFIPRQTLHAVRNTSNANMSYLAVTTNQEGVGYQAVLLDDVREAGGAPIDKDSEVAQTWLERRNNGGESYSAYKARKAAQ